MPAIPPFVLRKLYVRGSLQSEGDGFELQLKNHIAPGTITAFLGIDVDGQTVDTARVTLAPSGGSPRPAGAVSSQVPLEFPVGATVGLSVAGHTLHPGPHELVIRVVVADVGPLDIPIVETRE